VAGIAAAAERGVRPPEGFWVGQRLFRVAELFAFHIGRVLVITDCPLRVVPVARIGDAVEFRNPNGTAFRSSVAGIELAGPPDPERPFAFPLPSDAPADAVQVGAEVWSLTTDTRQAEPVAAADRRVDDDL
jgi:hypothetical protein